jgi:hypothetical protein
VTTGTFSRPAVEFAKAYGIRLIDGAELGGLVTQVYGDRDALMVRGLCRACGGTAQFDPENFDPVYRVCPNEHMVKHPFIVDTHPSVSQERTRLKSAGEWLSG